MLEERDAKSAAVRWHGVGCGHGVVHGPAGQGHAYGGEAMGKGKMRWNGVADGPARVVEGGAGRMGPTSRELSGEMGGDTTSV
jgi:hypothetical protein